jgi:ketosteroid isomerase-like protein
MLLDFGGVGHCVSPRLCGDNARSGAGFRQRARLTVRHSRRTIEGEKFGGGPMKMFPMVAALVLSGCAPSAPAVDAAAIEKLAHGGYVAAINSNDVDTLMADLTDDIVYQNPGTPEIVGKVAVRKWVADYFGAYRTRWEKTSIGFTVNGDRAFERYTYKSTDTDKKTGAVTTDTGKGINIFRRGADGKWRVAIDGWSSDLAPEK